MFDIVGRLWMYDDHKSCCCFMIFSYNKGKLRRDECDLLAQRIL
jgi:hypothetical protein